MTFIDDVKTQWYKLWSVRFSLGLSIVGVFQTAWAMYDGKSVIVPAVTIIGGIVIAISRVLKQDNLQAANGFELESANLDSAAIAAIVQQVLSSMTSTQKAAMLKGAADGHDAT